MSAIKIHSKVLTMPLYDTILITGSAIKWHHANKGGNANDH
nr:MAG TPA: hypothetical protein [Bacteriophage sp.]